MASTPSSSSRSSLIDHTYEDIYFLISGHRESLRPEQTTKTLNARIDKLKRIWEPFDGPNDASKKAIDSNTISLSDGTSVKVDTSTKTLALAISEHFSLDEVDAYVLLRSFLYNYGIVGAPAAGASKEEIVEWVIERLTPFYFSERLYVARTLIALLKCQQTVNDPFCSSARKILPQIIPDPSTFANKLIAEYRRKSQLPIPPKSSTNPRHASAWAKQNAKEQLVLLEILFWLLWDYSPVTAPIAIAMFTAAYETDFGHKQTNATSLLDTEGAQLKRDIAALWVLLTVEALNLEYLPETLKTLPERTDENGPLYSAPGALIKIHDLVMSHVAPGFVCTILAWALFIRAISKASANTSHTQPGPYALFLENIRSPLEITFRKGEQEVADTLLATCLSPEAGFFPFMVDLLQSPLLLSSVAIRTGSSVTDPGDIAYRALLKGLMICIIDAENVETLPDFEGLVGAWVALFGGNEETPFCGNLCRQFWDADWRVSKDRRALLDVARSRFPVQFRPLVRILRSLSGSMRLDNTDPDIGEDALAGTSVQDRQESAKYVHYYFAKLPTFAQVIPPSQRSGGNVLYDRIVDRPGPSRASGGAAYTNLRPLNLPGGTTVPAKTVGRLLSADNSNDNVVVAWQHEHSGWKLIVDVLLDYVYRRQGRARGSRRLDHVYGRRGEVPVTLLVGDIGIEEEEQDSVIADGLELILGIVQNNAPLTGLLMESLEEGGPLVSHTARDAAAPDLVQLIFMILDDVLGRANGGRANVPTALVAPCLGILTTLLSLPNYSNRVWLFLRSSPLLFGSERDASYSSPILSSERASGNYTMTISLLRLVRTLVEESISRLVTTHADQPRLQSIKEEVLLRAIHLVQNHIWVEHAGWRYTHLSERFEVSRGVMELYARIIESRSVFTSVDQNSGKMLQSPLANLVLGILLTHAATPTITPLVHAIASARTVLQALSAARRISELQSYGSLLEKALHLTRLVLQLKNMSSGAFPEHILLEQALCSDHATSSMLLRASRSSIHDTSPRANPVDVLMYLVGQRELGSTIPVEATRVLTSLCTALSESTSPDARPSLLSYLSDAQVTVAGIVRILKHPYDDLALRNALWTFVTVSVQKQPPLAILFVAGTFRVQPKSTKNVVRISDDELSAIDSSLTTKSASAVEAACSTLAGWKDLWETNPELLASVLGFLEVVWDRSLENLATLEPTRGDDQFWKHIAAIAREELGPAPDFLSTGEYRLEDELHSDLHDAVQSHAYRTKVKGHALKILGSDIAVHLQSGKGDTTKAAPASYNEIALFFENEELFRDAISETVSSSYDSELYDRLAEGLPTFAPLSIASLMQQGPLGEHPFGDDFMLSVPLLRAVLRSSMSSDSQTRITAEQAKMLVFSANQNMSLANSQLSLMRAWATLLGHVRGYLRNQARAKTILLSTAALASQDIAKETRSGDFMATIHGDRLLLLLALLEAAWFAGSDSSQQVKDFMSILGNVGDIIASESFPPGKSFLGLVSAPFHHSILLIIFFCAKKCQQLDNVSGEIRAEHRLLMSKVFTSSLTLVIDALRLTFDTAQTRLDIEVDKDMELLVAVFQQCTRKGLHSSATTWLTRCQETDVVGASLKLFCQTDASGLSDFDLLRSCGRPLYAPQVLSFHMTLASIPFTAERLASEGVIAAYSNNSISLALSEGAIATTLPELPNERSPAHRAYCAILANTTGIISNLVSAQQLIESHIIGFVQLYGQQMTKTLAWTNDEPLSLPRLEELELTVELFYLIASGAASSSRNDTAQQPVLRAFTEVALLLAQQLNYALTHPKHLTGILEPITANDRLRMDEETTSNIPVTSLSDLLNSDKRPIMASVVRRLFTLVAGIFNTLSIIGGCETVLLSDPEEWPTKEAVIVPHSKVKMGEPASIGTLLELGQCCLETLQYLTSKDHVVPLAASDPKSKSSKICADTLQAVRLALETALVYASTQLVLWLSKHDVEQANETMDAEELQFVSVGSGADGHGYGNRADISTSGARGRRIRRKSQTTLADRLRRGMTGEMTMDLQNLVSKSRATIASTPDATRSSGSADILLVVERFLEERTSASTS